MSKIVGRSLFACLLSVYFYYILCSKSVFGRTFELDRSWPDTTVSNLNAYGSGIALDGEKNLIVLHRSSAMLGPRNETIKEDVVIVVDRVTGKLLRSWGKNMFYHPHGIEITDTHDIFITDSRMHQVFKFQYNKDTKLWNKSPILTLGEQFVSGNDATHFCTPADIAVLHETGDFYVADGYCNSRVVKFDQTGKYIREFTAGSSTFGVPPIAFNITHAVTLAVRHPANPTSSFKQRILKRVLEKDENDILVFVADRDNSRIQCFNSQGKFLYEITNSQLGIPKTMLFSVAHVDVDTRDSPYDTNFTAEFGIIYGVNGYLPYGNSEVLEIGVSESNGTVISRFKTSPGETSAEIEAPHDLAVSRDGKEVYIVISNATQLILRKFVMKVGQEDGGGRSNSFSTTLGFLMVCMGVTMRIILKF